MNGLQAIFEMTSQLQESTPKSAKRIATSAIDSIFFELEAELELMIKEEQLTGDFLNQQRLACQELIDTTEAAVKALKAIEFLNDHQFYCFLRLKKILSNLDSFRKRYDSLINESLQVQLSNPINDENH